MIVSDQPVEIPLTWVSDQGVTVEKRYRFLPGNYLIGLDISLSNPSQIAIQDSLTLSLLNSAAIGSNQYGFEGASALINAKLEVTLHEMVIIFVQRVGVNSVFSI